MINDADAISFVRNYVKYRATKDYVAGISAAAISDVWRIMNATEYSGMPHYFYCGNISIDTLRVAFLREMSYNPLRFDGVNLMARTRTASPVSEIVDAINRILDRFAALWPRGIQGRINITDIAGPAYSFLRDLRDCFKKIAMQNTADLKLSDYRDEIIARFAGANDIAIDNDIRAVLRRMASASAPRRANIREMANLNTKMSGLRAQMNMHRGNDRAFCEEVRGEIAQLKARHDFLAHQVNALHHAGPSAPRVEFYDGAVMHSDDAAERELELLRTLTPAHNIDGIFAEYVERQVGLKLSAGTDEHHR